MDEKKLQEAKKLFDTHKYKKACELLFGKAEGVAAAQPELELIEGDGRKRTLEEAEAYWKSQDCEIARMKDIYAMADSLLTPEQLESIRKDCCGFWRWIISDRLVYAGRMVSVNGGGFVECPEYNGVLLAEVLGTQAGLAFIQALCGTKDGADAIMRKLVKLSGMGRDSIRFWTLPMVSRKAHPLRAAGFSYSGGGFQVNGLYNLSYNGRSRGVRVRER